MTYEVREKFYQGHYREASDFPIPNTQYTALYLDGEKHSLNLDKPKQTHVSHYHSEKIMSHYVSHIHFLKIQS